MARTTTTVAGTNVDTAPHHVENANATTGNVVIVAATIAQVVANGTATNVAAAMSAADTAAPKATTAVVMGSVLMHVVAKDSAVMEGV